MSKIKVLIVDDSALVRQILTEICNSDPGIEVVGVAQDPYDAREKIKKLNPDVLTLDVEMPRMDGYELATTMRNDTRLKTVPIIMITSRTGDKHRQRALDIGVNQYMGKPYQEQELIENIRALIDIEHH